LRHLDYQALCQALQLNFNPDNRFKPSDFFVDEIGRFRQSVDAETPARSAASRARLPQEC